MGTKYAHVELSGYKVHQLESLMMIVCSGPWIVLCVLCFACVIVAWLKRRWQSGEGRVQVLVLGDAGRSPRMQYHCLSLLNEGYAVDLVGYGGGDAFTQQTHKRPHFIQNVFRVQNQTLVCWQVPELLDTARTWSAISKSITFSD